VGCEAAEIPLLKVLKRPYVLLLGSSARHKNVDVLLAQAPGLDAAGIDIVVVSAASSIFPRTRPTISDPTFITPAMSAMTIWPPSTSVRYVWHMAKGCSVISSNAASLVEVGGDAVAMWIPITAMAGATRSSAWRETGIFARLWRRTGASERRCFPGNAARSFTSYFDAPSRV